MSQLEQDLTEQWDTLEDAVTKRDVIKGLLIISAMVAEVAAVITLIVVVIKASFVLTGGLASLGYPAVANHIRWSMPRILTGIMNQYCDLSKEHRRAVLIALKFLGVTPVSIRDVVPSSS